METEHAGEPEVDQQSEVEEEARAFAERRRGTKRILKPLPGIAKHKSVHTQSAFLIMHISRHFYTQETVLNLERQAHSAIKSHSGQEYRAISAQ